MVQDHLVALIATVAGLVVLVLILAVTGRRMRTLLRSADAARADLRAGVGSLRRIAASRRHGAPPPAVAAAVEPPDDTERSSAPGQRIPIGA